MAHEEISDIWGTIPKEPEKKCKFCNKPYEPLEYDEAVEGWVHPKCLERHIEMEIKEALLKAKITFKEAYHQNGGGND